MNGKGYRKPFETAPVAFPVAATTTSLALNTATRYEPLIP